MRFCLLLFLLFAGLRADAAEWVADSVPHIPGPEAAKLWLRCHIRVQDNMTVPQEKDLWRDSVTLSFAEMAGAFSVLLNGQKIVDSGAVGKTARRFKVPKGILEKGAFNSLLIALPKDFAIARPPVLAGYFDEIILAGDWQKSATEPSGDGVFHRKAVSQIGDAARTNGEHAGATFVAGGIAEEVARWRRTYRGGCPARADRCAADAPEFRRTRTPLGFAVSAVSVSGRDQAAEPRYVLPRGLRSRAPCSAEA